jgi:hypothetical protein
LGCETQYCRYLEPPHCGVVAILHTVAKYNLL